MFLGIIEREQYHEIDLFPSERPSKFFSSNPTSKVFSK